MNKFILSAIGILALGACASHGDDGEAMAERAAAAAAVPDDRPTGPAAPFVARGNEPGWRIEVGEAETSFTLDYGERRFAAPTPEPVIEGGRAAYEYTAAGPVPAMTLDIAAAPCADDATGMPHPMTATLKEGGRVMNGCAGDPLDLLTGDDWVVEDILGGGVIDASRATLAFSEDGRVSGSGSCNRYHAGFALTGEGLNFGPAAATRKACAPALMNQEAKFFEALSRADRFEIDETGALVLVGGADRLLLARRG